MIKGRAYPKISLHKCIAYEIKRLGYKLSAMPSDSVSVSIEQLTIKGVNDLKDSDDYECTWLLSVVSRAQTPEKLDEAVEVIREGFTIMLEGYVVQEFEFGDCMDFPDMD